MSGLRKRGVLGSEPCVNVLPESLHFFHEFVRFGVAEEGDTNVSRSRSAISNSPPKPSCFKTGHGTDTGAPAAREALVRITLAMIEHGIEQRFINPAACALYFVASTVDEAIEHIRTYDPPVLADKWFEEAVPSGVELNYWKKIHCGDADSAEEINNTSPRFLISSSAPSAPLR